MANPTLLIYDQSSEPNPLQANKDGVITLSIKPSSTAVLCKQIVLTLSYGTGSGDIFTDKPTVSDIIPSDSGWSLSAPIIKKGTTSLVITLNNSNPGYSVPAAIGFTISGKVNATTSQGTITIKEDSAPPPTTGAPSFTDKTGSLTVPTVLPPMAINSFIATVDDASSVPATEFTNGTAFGLSWSGASVTNYQVFEGNKTTPIYNGSDTEYKVTDGLTNTTTFTLVATGTEGQTLIQTLTVTISNPVLTPTSSTITPDGYKPGLMVKGSTSLDGDLTVESTSGDSVTTTSVENLRANGSLLVTAEAFLTDVNATSLEVSGNVNLGLSDNSQLAINGKTFINNELNIVSGPVAAFGYLEFLFNSKYHSPEPLQSRSLVSFMTATNISVSPESIPTDGLLIVTLNNDPDKAFNAFNWTTKATITLNSNSFNLAAFSESPESSENSDVSINNSASITLPVQKGSTFTCTGTAYWTSLFAPGPYWTPIGTISLHWVPLGSQTVKMKEPEITHKEVLVSEEINIEETSSVIDGKRTERIDVLVEQLHELKDTDDSRTSLKNLLEELL